MDAYCRLQPFDYYHRHNIGSSLGSKCSHYMVNRLVSRKLFKKIVFLFNSNWFSATNYCIYLTLPLLISDNSKSDSHIEQNNFERLVYNTLNTAN